MKQRILALLLAAALTLSLLSSAALAADGDVSAPDSSAGQTEENQSPETGDAAPEGDTAVPERESDETEAPVPDEDAPENGEDESPVEEYIPDPAGAVTFQNLDRRIREGNLQIRSIQENVDILEEIDYDKLKEDLRLQLNQLAQAQWMMVQFGQSGTLAYERMDQAYDAVREQFDAIKDGDMQADNAETIRQLQNLQNQIVMAGEATYIALAAMENQETGLERQLAALDRALEELQLRYKLGHISSLTLHEAQAGRAALNSGLSTLRMNLNTYKGQLELLIGAEITGEISMSPLPTVTQEELDSMNLEQDLETAKENSWDLYQATETMKEERKKYYNVGGDAASDFQKKTENYKRVKHTWMAAKYTYDNTVWNFELGLRNLYLKVRDYQQVLAAARTTLAVKRDSYAAAQLKYQQGAISANTLLEAEDDLKEARETVAGAENDLFSSYNTYRWAVDYGIIN